MTIPVNKALGFLKTGALRQISIGLVKPNKLNNYVKIIAESARFELADVLPSPT